MSGSVISIQVAEGFNTSEYGFPDGAFACVIGRRKHRQSIELDIRARNLPDIPYRQSHCASPSQMRHLHQSSCRHILNNRSAFGNKGTDTVSQTAPLFQQRDALSKTQDLLNSLGTENIAKYQQTLRDIAQRSQGVYDDTD
jgi:hypothetical protein